MSNRTHEPAVGTTLYSISTVAARLDVSQDTVRRLIAQGELTPIRIGFNVRIDATELEAFVHRQRQSASDDAESTDPGDALKSPGDDRAARRSSTRRPPLGPDISPDFQGGDLPKTPKEGR